MTFENNLQKSEIDTIAEFYLVQYGNLTYRYTSYSHGFTLAFLGQDWKSGSIARSGFKEDRQFNSVTMSISTPLTDVMKKYIPNFPVEPMTITVYRALLDDLTKYRTLFSGKVVGVQIKDRQVNLQVESKNKILSRTIPRIVYQSFCNNDLFDNYGHYGCRLNPDEWKKTGEVVAIDGFNIQLDFGEVISNNYFSGGRLILDSDMRLITSNTGSILSVHVPFDDRIDVGVEVIAYPGCDGNPNTCLDKFDNWSNFLGMPLIPDHNPVLWGFR